MILISTTFSINLYIFCKVFLNYISLISIRFFISANYIKLCAGIWCVWCLKAPLLFSVYCFFFFSHWITQCIPYTASLPFSLSRTLPSSLSFSPISIAPHQFPLMPTEHSITRCSILGTNSPIKAGRGKPVGGKGSWELTKGQRHSHSHF